MHRKTRSGDVDSRAMSPIRNATRKEMAATRRKHNATEPLPKSISEQFIFANNRIKYQKTKPLDNSQEHNTKLENPERNFQARLFSPTTTQRRVKSQERTPKGHRVTRKTMCEGKVDTTLVTNNCFESRQTPTDENSNSVLQSPTRRYLLKQLLSTLSPKLTEINTDADRRVSRYGRHQKQKENVDYVPVELMRFVSNSPLKFKAKVDSAGLTGSVSVPSNNMESKMCKDTSTSSTKSDSSIVVVDHAMIQNNHEDLLSMEEINIISAEECIDQKKEKDEALENIPKIHNLFERKRSSDIDSAKGSSIDLDGGYHIGQICWGAQTLKSIHWPCIIRNDPENGQIFRKTVGKMTEIHVNYFGDKGRRGWIKEAGMMPFEGLENYRSRIKSLEFGKDVQRALKAEMPKTWTMACTLAEICCAIPIEERLEKFDADVKLDLARRQIYRRRILKNARSNIHILKKLHTAQCDGMEVSRKRERSTSPESPAYEAIPIYCSTDRQNNTKKIKLPTSHSSPPYTSNINRFFQSLHHEEQINVDGEELYENESIEKAAAMRMMNANEYDDVLKFVRYYLYDGHTSREVEKKLQLYVQKICSLKKESSRGTERTVERRRMQALRKTYEKFGFECLTSIDNDVTKSAKIPPVVMKKELKSLEEKFIFNLERNFLTKGLPKGFVCYVCSRPNEVTKCTKCMRHVHVLCLTEDPMELIKMRERIKEKQFHCFECIHAEDVETTTWQRCFICNDENLDTKHDAKYRCSGNICNRGYHLSCLRLFPQYRTINAKTIICPYHVCHTCVSEDPRGKASVMRVTLARCIKCPAAYHPDDRCIPAGSQLLTTTQLVCPKHSLDQTPLNVNWCFLCCKGGDLICCETCPIAFHRDCLPFTPPDGKYFCEECESGRMPLYNEIVIAKLGSFRWWPALTVPPSEIPQNVLEMRQKPSDICVKFFNSHDMAWLNRKRMYLYQDGDSENLGREKSGSLDKKYRSAMAEASKIYKTLLAAKTSRQSTSIQKQITAPVYTKIKINRYIAPLKQPVARRQQDAIEDSVCRCLPDDNDPCGPTSACINRAIMMECSPKTCPAMEHCLNQRFARRIYPALEVRYFADKGFGLVALEDLKGGQFIIEYVGEVINSSEFDRRVKMMQSLKEQNYYFFTVEPDMTIDAGPKGNVSRFINHSCEPNCETQKWTIGATRVIGLFAVKDIKTGEELTFNYNLESLGNSKRICLCGALRCSGFIGEKYRPPTKETVRNDTLGRVRKNNNKRTTHKTKKDLLNRRNLLNKLRTNKRNSTDNDVELIPDPEPVLVDLINTSGSVQSLAVHIKIEK